MRLAHALLNLLRIGVDDELGSLRQREIGPSTLKDMGEGQEVDHAVLARDVHTAAIGSEGGVIHAISEDDAFR